LPSFVIHGDKLLVDNAVKDCLAEYDATELLESNIHYLFASRLDFNELLHICNSIPFMDKYRAVIIDGLCTLMETNSNSREPKNRNSKTNAPWLSLPEHLLQMPDSTLVFFKDGVLNRNNSLLGTLMKVSRTTHLPPPNGIDLSRWIKTSAADKGAGISPGAIKSLSILLGNDLRSIDHELEKLSLYTNGGPIQESDVQEMVPQAQEANIFQAVDAIIAGRAQASLNFINNLKAHGRDSTYIIPRLTGQLRRLTLVHSLLRSGTSQAEIGRILDISSQYAIQKTVEQSSKYSSDDIKWKYEQLLQCDLNIKLGKLSADQALETLVFNLSKLYS